MPIELKGKNILIISPQPFAGLFISKQHYAMELAKRGNKIYFLEPPLMKGRPSVKLEAATSAPSITLVKYRPFFNLNYRFHFRFLFDLLMRAQVNRIIKNIPDNIDIVWCFESNLYASLSWFNGHINIYHVVDPVKENYQIAVGNSAHIILCVSKKILSSFSQVKVPRYFINHGISGSYFKLAGTLLTSGSAYKPGKTIRIGYIGNLLRGPINYQVIRQTIVDHPSISFHFWGNDQINEETGAGSKAFISFLKGRENVLLHGQKKPEELVVALQDMDAFLLAYLYVEGESDRSNSHKVLEYLSTGKVLISSLLDTYKDAEPLICMTDEDDSAFPALFSKVIHDLDYYNSPALQKKRIEISLENSYSDHINKIENLLDKL